MPTYTVQIAKIVKAAVTVEADDAEVAREAFADADDMPGSLVHGAFGYGAAVDEAGDWQAAAVLGADGVEVWADRARVVTPPPADVVERLQRYVGEYDGRAWMPDQVHAFGLGAGAPALLVSDVRALLAAFPGGAR